MSNALKLGKPEELKIEVIEGGYVLEACGTNVIGNFIREKRLCSSEESLFFALGAYLRVEIVKQIEIKPRPEK